MTLQNWKKKAFIVGLFSGIEVLILSIFAIIFYPGGSLVDHYATRYSFWANTISDLGVTVAFGKSNLISFTIFSIMFTIWAILIIVTFLALPSLFGEGRKRKWLGSFFAWVSAIAVIGVVLSPGDIRPQAHLFFAGIFYLALILTDFMYFSAIFSDKEFPNRYAISLLGSVICIFIYLLLLLLGQDFLGVLLIPEAAGIAQKISTYFQFVAISYVSYGSWKLATQKTS